MTKTRILVLISLLFYFYFHQAYPQVSSDRESLISILNAVQEKFQCSFSYVNDELSDVKIIPPAQTLNLNQTISYLENNTSFDYTFLDKKNIAISYREKSYEICGKLISTADNTFISSATIQTKKTTTISDGNGEFRIKVVDKDQLITINYLGYKTLQIKAIDFDNRDCLRLFLTPEIQRLNQVIIKDYITKGINANANGSITIDYKNFGILPGLIEPDLLQTVQALPGILSVNETVSDINVRGGTNDQNLILWDGIKMYQSSHFFGLISAFNPYLTKNVRLYKNGSSSRFGDGVSSVISMNTENDLNKEFEASLGLNMISADGYIDAPIGKKSSLQFAIRSSINNIVETPTYDQYFDKVFQDSEVLGGSDQKFSFYDTSIRWLYQLSPKDLIKVNGLFMRNNLVFQETNTVESIDVSRESSIEQNNLAGGILYRRNWNDLLQTELMAYGTSYDIEAINSDIINNQRLLQENEVLESGLKFNALIKVNSHLNFTAGYQFNETGISDLRDLNNPTFTDLVKEVIRTNSFFSEIEYQSSNKTTYINLGLRANHFDKFNKILVEPRISLNQKFLDHFNLEILGELKSQVTSQIISLQNDFLGIENRKWVLSNENDIPILQSKQGSAGISYNHKNWLIRSEIYYKEVDGIIARSQGFQNQFESSRDHGSYKVTGLDFLLSKRIKNFGTWLSYSYAKNDYSFNNLLPGDFPNNLDIRHNVNLALTYNVKDFKLSTGLNWHSGKPATGIASNTANDNGEIDFLSPNNETLNDYLRVDISATYSFKITEKMNGFMGLSIWNILAENNIVNNYYRIHSDNTIKEIQEFGLGFTPNAVFRINF